jgi:hypothetical protein
MYVTFTGKRYSDLDDGAAWQLNKYCNNFYHPMANSSKAGQLTVDFLKGNDPSTKRQQRYLQRTYNPLNELSYHIQLGNQLFPEYPCDKNSQAFYHLCKTLKHQNTPFSSIKIQGNQYFNHTFIIGQNFERVEGAKWSGINTKGGDLMNIKIKTPTVSANDRPDRMIITLAADVIINIGNTGVQVFD